MKRPAAFVLLAALTACVANPPAPGLLRFDNALHSADTPGPLHWLVSPGLGEAITDCGGDWIAIAGGAYSPTATDVGTGYPGSSGSTWDAYSANPKAAVLAFALCAPANGLSGYFYRAVGGTTKKHKTSAVASCSAGDTFVEGWASGWSSQGPVISKGGPTGWFAAGTTRVTSYAECATHLEASGTGMVYVTKTGGPGRLFVGCGGPPGDDDDVIGSSFGSSSATGAGKLGPPELEYPGLSNGTPSTGPTGVWFVSKSGNVGWVLCQEDT